MQYLASANSEKVLYMSLLSHWRGASRRDDDQTGAVPPSTTTTWPVLNPLASRTGKRVRCHSVRRRDLQAGGCLHSDTVVLVLPSSCSARGSSEQPPEKLR
jgi:hypothetical protein